jgi:hypothetical protein
MGVKRNSIRRGPAPHARREGGAALLAFMLVIITGSSYVLLTKLNNNIQQAEREQATAEALLIAKAALIGYAVTYPDKINAADGPGYLPCPDITNNGQAGGSCSFAGGTTIGRLPFETLELPDLRDGSGERLWYVLSQNFRNNPKLTPLNSDTPGTLTVDSAGDVVAIVIAPGAPVTGQNNRNTAVNDPAEYLEGENADGDLVFSRSGNGEFNDRAAFITRTELMTAVEKRVLGEVARKLEDYRSAHSAYPWLSPFADPSSSSFKSQLSSVEGHLPYHWSDDTAGASNRNPFQTSLSWIWHTTPGTATGSYSGTVTADCLRDVDCDDGFFPVISSVDADTIECAWTDRDTVECDTSGWVTMSTISCNQGCATDGTCTRQYKVTFPEYTGTTVTVSDPSASSVRTRDVELSGSLPSQSRAVEILDTYTGPTTAFLCLLSGTTTIGSGYINFVSTTTGTIGTSRVQYDLDVDDGELPEWFVKNDWQELVYVAYSSGESLPGGGTTCTAGTDCLVLNNTGSPNDDKRALAVIAGAALGTQDRAASPTLADYLESDNQQTAISPRAFRKDVLSGTFNDQVRVIATAP